MLIIFADLVKFTSWQDIQTVERERFTPNLGLGFLIRVLPIHLKMVVFRIDWIS
jgi:hypothetical protein